MVELIEIDVSPLYKVSRPESPASNLLASILKGWGLGYRLLMVCSPDIGEYFFDDEFGQCFVAKQKKAEGRLIDEEEVVKEFAERKKAIPVRLFDGYECAYAIVFPRR